MRAFMIQQIDAAKAQQWRGPRRPFPGRRVGQVDDRRPPDLPAEARPADISDGPRPVPKDPVKEKPASSPSGSQTPTRSSTGSGTGSRAWSGWQTS